jgi:WD40 repeat protein
MVIVKKDFYLLCLWFTSFVWNIAKPSEKSELKHSLDSHTRAQSVLPMTAISIARSPRSEELLSRIKSKQLSSIIGFFNKKLPVKTIWQNHISPFVGIPFRSVAHTLETQSRIKKICCNRQNTKLVALTFDGAVHVYDTQAKDAQDKDTVLCSQSASTLDCRTKIVIGKENGQVEIYRDDHRLETAWQAHDDEVDLVALNHQETQLATGSTYHGIKVWDLQDGNLLGAINVNLGGIANINWPVNDNQIAVKSEEGLRIYNARNRRLFLAHPASDSDTAAYSPSGLQLAVGNTIINTDTGTIIHTLAGHTTSVHSIDWKKDHTQIVTASQDKQAKIWDAISGKLLFDLPHNGPVTAIKWSHNNFFIATACGDTIYIWKPDTGKMLYALKGHEATVTNLFWKQQDSPQLISASDDATVKIWDLQNTKDSRLTVEQLFFWQVMVEKNTGQKITLADRSLQIFESLDPMLRSHLKPQFHLNHHNKKIRNIVLFIGLAAFIIYLANLCVNS